LRRISRSQEPQQRRGTHASRLRADHLALSTQPTRPRRVYSLKETKTNEHDNSSVPKLRI